MYVYAYKYFRIEKYKRIYVKYVYIYLIYQDEDLTGLFYQGEVHISVVFSKLGPARAWV